MTDLSARARDWALWLTAQPSVTGSAGERALPELLLRRVRATPALSAAETWLVPAPDGRACAALLVRGEGAEAVLLTGHFDTVSADDYGDLAALACEPEALRTALLARLAHPASPAEERARNDLAGPDFLPGRGLLDMKAGLAAGLALCEHFAAEPGRTGNLLFVAVPDEEATSVGARALARAIPAIEAERGVRLVAAVNLDSIADDGDGAAGRTVALGSVGKLLLTALAVGRPSHACYPFSGVNAAAIAAALVRALEWAPALADHAAGQQGMPPTLLGLKDDKAGYDVTTPSTVWAIWNTLSLTRSAAETLASARSAMRAALDDLAAALDRRREAVAAAEPAVQPIPLLDAATVMEEAAASPGGAEALRLEAMAAAEAGETIPEQCRRITRLAFARSGRSGPAVVLGFGSLPYPAVQLGGGRDDARLRAAVDHAGARAMAAGVPVAVAPFFQGISDMSFLGRSNPRDLPLVVANTPAWETGVCWAGEVGGLPVVNAGPWGRDYHTPLERLHTPYAFATLPALLDDLVRKLFEAGPEDGPGV